MPTNLAQTGVPDPGTTGQGREVPLREGLSLLPGLRGEAATTRDPDEVLVDEIYDHRCVVEGD
jgi:hypothetical protein